MKKTILILSLILITTNSFAQTKGMKIGYIDMEYILENVPSYKDANDQLNIKAENWKKEIEVKKNEIEKAKQELKAEKSVLTQNIIEEKEQEILFLETDLVEMQQSRFGPGGAMITQKTNLIKPIQDQIFTAIQDLAETQKYDFIFDKSSDFTILFAQKRYDISDLIIRILSRADKREKLSKKQLEAELAKEDKEDKAETNPNLVDRQKALDEKKAAREKLLQDRKDAAAAKRKEIEDLKNGIVSVKDSISTDKTASTIETAEEARVRKLEERKLAIEARKKELEERRQKIMQERDSIKKVRELQLELNKN
jgi:Skp family chaperone for outer membrane proteins